MQREKEEEEVKRVKTSPWKKEEDKVKGDR
jgi:hypothetical protein